MYLFTSLTPSCRSLILITRTKKGTTHSSKHMNIFHKKGIRGIGMIGIQCSFTRLRSVHVPGLLPPVVSEVVPVDDGVSIGQFPLHVKLGS